MSEDYEKFLAAYSPAVQKLAQQVRSLVFKVIPEVSEHVYPAMKVIRYGLDGNKMAGLVCFLSPTKAGVSLGFMHGTSLPDPKKLLEGTGKNLRHVKLRDPKEVKDPAVAELLKAGLAEAKRRR